MNTVDDLRREALEKVRRWYVEGSIRPAYCSAESAWGVLKHLASMYPGWRVSQYYLRSGSIEENKFMQEWEAWRQSVNG